MALQWQHENPALWDAHKARIVGAEPPGVFDSRYANVRAGQLVPGEWWRVEEDGEVVAYGWLDVNWGDAEVLLATEPGRRGQGIGSFVMAHLEAEAARRGLNYLTNLVRPTHPDGAQLAAWLEKRGFIEVADGRHVRSVRRAA